jgi:hypothetical protein
MAALALLIGLSVNNKLGSFWQQAIGLWVIIVYWTVIVAAYNCHTRPLNRV